MEQYWFAQNFVGTNNINLFKPRTIWYVLWEVKIFSERYIFTILSKITRAIFPEIDDNILTYLQDDGDFVEPIYYMPIIPNIL